MDYKHFVMTLSRHLLFHRVSRALVQNVIQRLGSIRLALALFTAPERVQKFLDGGTIGDAS